MTGSIGLSTPLSVGSLGGNTSRWMSTSGSVSRQSQLDIIGAPMSWGQPKRGTENGPEHLRRAGLVENLTEYFKYDFDVHDTGTSTSLQNRIFVSIEIYSHLQVMLDDSHWHDFI
jgi:hypothetical protein